MLQSDKNIFGLDIGDQALRLIQIKKNGKKNFIISHNEFVLPTGVISDGEILKPEILIKCIRELIKQAKGKKIYTRNVISVLPETKTFIKLIKINVESENDIEAAIKEEISKNIPLSIDEIYYDWQIIGNLRLNEETKILIGAAPKQIINSYLGVLRNADLIPFVLEIEGAAIARSLLAKKIDNPGGTRIIIDLGANRTGLILCNKDSVQFTVSLPISGSEITNTIAQKLKLDQKQAERAKIICGLDETKCEGALKKILFGNISQLIDKIQEAISFYQETCGNGKIQEIILCGGGANFAKIDKVLQERLQIPVRIGNPLANINKIQKSAEIKSGKILSYTTAIGLALRGTENNFI